MARLLLVEDNEELAALIHKWLKEDSHTVDVALDGEGGEDLLHQVDFDLIILDWKLPIKSGIDLCQSIRAQGKTVPILMLTGKGDIDDKVKGFESGADDYLTKPFLPPELLARVKALLRRPPTFSGTVLTVGDHSLNLAQRFLSKAGREVPLQRQEFALLEYFMRHPNQVISTARLLNSGWNTDSDISQDALYACIARLRRKLKSIGSESLTTVHSQGYLFKE